MSTPQPSVPYRLFLDDLRAAPAGPDWLVCRTVVEAITAINQRGLPIFLSFDHDLGEGEGTGLELVKWLIQGHLDKRFDLINPPMEWFVHSMNPVGRENIIGLMEAFIREMQHIENMNLRHKGDF